MVGMPQAASLLRLPILHEIYIISLLKIVFTRVKLFA